MGYARRFNIADRLEKRSGRPPLERVVQDIEAPIGRAAEFVDWFLQNVPIEPIWLCPLRLRDTAESSGGWPLYPIRPHHTYVNVGFWSSVPAKADEGHTNKLIERKVSELDGHKSLYSDAYYTPDEFAELREAGLAMAFTHVQASPLTRSSYHAWEQAEQAKAGRTR